MLFNSIQAASFVAVVWAIYWQVDHRRRLLVLLVASYAFYATFDVRFLGLLLFVTAVDAVASPRLTEGSVRSRRTWLGLALGANLAVLGAFKYADFFVGATSELLERLGLEPTRTSVEVLLPIGISFYVFQSISYCIDVHRGRIEHERDPLVLATFVSFFPQLAAGPIERGERLLPQLRQLPDRRRPGDLAVGTSLILLGLVRKVVIADTLAPAVAQAFTQDRVFFGVAYTVDHSWATFAAGALAFTAMLYGDFAGYSTMARGIAKLFGIDLSANFQRPLWSPSPAELWRRWHITLMSWLRDYVYFPLWSGRALKRVVPGREVRAGVATWCVFVLAGLWHAAEGRWLLWGALTGAVVGGEVWWRGRTGAARARAGGGAEPRPPRWPAHLATLLLFVVLAVPVGAADLAQTMDVWTGLATAQAGEVQREVLLLAAFGWAVLVATDRHEATLEQIERWWHDQGGGTPPPGRDRRPPLSEVSWGLRAGAMLLGLLTFAGGSGEPFFYFRF